MEGCCPSTRVAAPPQPDHQGTLGGRRAGRVLTRRKRQVALSPCLVHSAQYNVVAPTTRARGADDSSLRGQAIGRATEIKMTSRRPLRLLRVSSQPRTQACTTASTTRLRPGRLAAASRESRFLAEVYRWWRACSKSTGYILFTRNVVHRTLPVHLESILAFQRQHARAPASLLEQSGSAEEKNRCITAVTMAAALAKNSRYHRLAFLHAC